MKTFVATFAVALLLVAFFVVRPTGDPGVAMRDLEAFYSAGVVANRGEDPYGRAIWSAEQQLPGIDGSHDETLPFVGPPAGLPLWRALAVLPYDIAGRTWGAILAAALLVVVFGAMALANAPRDAMVVLGVAIFAAAYGPLISDVALGQVALIAAAGIVAALLLLRTRHWVFASLGAACAALQPSLVLVLIARLSDVRAFLALALGGLIFAACMLANGGLGGTIRYLQLLSVHNAAEVGTVIQITPASVTRGFGAPAYQIAVVHWTTLVLALAFTVFAVWKLRDPVLRVGVASCALAFVIPFVHEHDFVLLLLPAICCAIAARGRTLAFVAVAATASGVDWLGLGQRTKGEPQAIVLSIACALGFALAANLRRESFMGLVVPFAVAAVCLIARTHPVPVWPDTLPPHWHAPAEASVSQVWALEQQLAGLDRTESVWSALRALSLLSALLLGVATFATGNVLERAGSDSRRDERMGIRRLAPEILPEGATGA